MSAPRRARAPRGADGISGPGSYGSRPPHPPRWAWPAAIVVIVAAVAVVVAVVATGGGRGTPSGSGTSTASAASSPAALLDETARVLASGGDTGPLTCASSPDAFRDVEGVPVLAARSAGAPTVTGTSARGSISLTARIDYAVPGPSGQAQSATATPTVTAVVRMSRERGAWCVTRFEADFPSY